MRLIFLIILLFPGIAIGQSPRKIRIECSALFPFDPLRDRYVSGSLAQAVDYVTQWRETDSLELTITYIPSLGYRIYESLVDSTLSERVLAYFSPCQIATQVDSTINAVNFNSFPHSRKFLEHFDDDIQRIKRFYASPIATLADTISVADCYYGPSTFASLFHSFQMEVSLADVSFFAPSSESGMLKENIYVKDIYNLFRFDNSLVVIELTGREIKQYLQDAYSQRFHRLRDQNSDLVRFRIPYYLHISAAGLAFRMNLVKGKIEDFSLPLDSTYRVVMNSFIAQKFNRKIEYLDDYNIMFSRWLQQKGALNPEIIETWSLSPERWVEAISKRERLLKQH